MWLAPHRAPSHTARPSHPTVPSILWHQNNTQLPATTIITVISPWGHCLEAGGGELHTFLHPEFPSKP